MIWLQLAYGAATVFGMVGFGIAVYDGQAKLERLVYERHRED